jgi:putative oxidoreductase
MQRYYIPAVGKIYAALDPYVLSLLRVGIGLILVPHGAQKLFGWFGGAGFVGFIKIFEDTGYKPGAFWTGVVGVTEFVGGLMLALGLFTRFWAAGVVIFMLNAVWITSARGFFWSSRGSEYSILILLVGLVFLVKGGGHLSIDSKMRKEL